MSAIVPAILTSDQVDLGNKLRILEGFADGVHLDVADGRFVSETTLSGRELAAIPTSLNREFHLMVWEPIHMLADMGVATADRVVLHADAGDDLGEICRFAKNSQTLIVLGINPETAIEAITESARELGRVLVMGVHPGRQGGEFLPVTVERIKRLRQLAPDVEITVDGGVNQERIPRLQAAGATRFVVGSAIWTTSEPAIAYQGLLDLTLTI